MMVNTYSEARQKLAQLLDEVLEEGEVRIKRKDGQEFVVRAVSKNASPLDVPGIDVGINATEIVQFIQDGRRYNP